jgi:hypothetical protein
MSARSKEKPPRGGKGLRKLTTHAGYHALVVRATVWRLLQKRFCATCWSIEQRASKLEDRIANERGYYR